MNISDIQGPLRSIWAERRWLVADLKKQLEKSRSDPRDRIWVGLKVWRPPLGEQPHDTPIYDFLLFWGPGDKALVCDFIYLVHNLRRRPSQAATCTMLTCYA